jgi:hypothetical protein
MDIRAFKGLNNATDPLRVGLGWLTSANNINVTDTGGIAVRDGYSRVSSAPVSAAYSTLDFQRMYLVSSGALKTFDGATLRSGLSVGEMYWAEVNGQVYFNNGTDAGVIEPDNRLMDLRWPVPAEPTVTAITGNSAPGTYTVCLTTMLPDGRETGTGEHVTFSLVEGQGVQLSGIQPPAGCVTNVYLAPANSGVFQLAVSTAANAFTLATTNPDFLGRELQTAFMDPLPTDTSVIQFWKARLYAAQHMPAQDQTVIWFSEALGYHLFNLNSNYFIVPGKVLMLAPHDDGLIVGTDRRIHLYSGDKLVELADYGVVPGQHWTNDDKRILFWSLRGVCAALPFTNLTERQVSVAPGVQAGGTIVRTDGQKRYVVALHQGGAAFNKFN